MIPQSFIDDLLQRVDVVDIVGRYVKLRKGGANYVGLCPFHNEKSPSFSVSPTKQFYHCFGCGAHGTALGFLIEYSGLTFPDAVRELAQGVGMTVPETPRRAVSGGSDASGPPGAPDGGGERGSSSVRLLDALEVAAAFYRNALRRSDRAIAYLKGRGLSGEVAARFGLGYAPSGWQALEGAFEDYRNPLLAEAGLVVTKSDDADAAAEARRYDRFRDRVMFPIRNGRGRVIGFGGRVIDDGEPKYLNSPETPVFQKGNELYGLFEGRQAIRAEGCAIVVEGYMDVVALAQLGIGNAVATLGTACTPQHVRALVRQTDQVVFSFDGDAAGQKAARRALEAALPFAADDKSFRFLFLPAEDDPDSYVRARGRDAFQNEVRRALPLSEYLVAAVRQDNDLATAEGRAKLLFDAQPLVRALPDGALRLQIVRALAACAKTDVDEVMARFQLARPRTLRRDALARVERHPPQGLVEQALLSLIMYPGNAALLGASDLDVLASVDDESRDLVLECVAAAKSLGSDGDFLAMAGALRELQHAATYETLLQKILALQENRRDLLLPDASGEDDRGDAGGGDAKGADAPDGGQREIHARELRNLVRKLRGEALARQLRERSERGLIDEASIAEFRRLLDEQQRLRADVEP